MIRQIGLALLAEALTSEPVGRLYADSLTQTLALHVVRHYSVSRRAGNVSGRLSGYKLRRAKDFINDHLEQDLTLAVIAESVGGANSTLRVPANGVAMRQPGYRIPVAMSLYGPVVLASPTGKIETVSRQDVSCQIGVEDVGRSLLLIGWVTGRGPLARLNADNDDNQNGWAAHNNGPSIRTVYEFQSVLHKNCDEVLLTVRLDRS